MNAIKTLLNATAILMALMFATSLQGGVIITTLFSFHGTNGIDPEGKLVQGLDGKFYGTTRDTAAPGGNYGFSFYGHGTVFRITKDGAFTTLLSFAETNGAYPRAGLILGNDGNFYGTTAGGGTKHQGTVFKITTNGILTMLASFTVTNGACPVASLVQNPDGTFFGTAAFGGTRKKGVPPSAVSGRGFFDYGTVFSITTNGVLKTLALFNGTNGANPYKKLTLGKDGNIYGSTTLEGLDDSVTNNLQHSGFGTLFKILPDGTLNTLIVFNGTNGIGPSDLIHGNDGNFYGTTQWGGTTYGETNDAYNGLMTIRGDGTVFRISPSGKFSTLVSFVGANGNQPNSLVLGKDGNFYGSTASGGIYDRGILFQISSNGVFTILHSFTGKNDDEAIGNLTEDTDGKFYGTSGGGKYGCGRVFCLVITSN